MEPPSDVAVPLGIWLLVEDIWVVYFICSCKRWFQRQISRGLTLVIYT